MQLNSVALIGRLVRDPDLHSEGTSKPWAVIRLAVPRTYVGGEGRKRESVAFIDAITWGRRAEAAAKWLTKGRLVLVRGYLETRSFVRRDGERAEVLRIQVEDLQFFPDAPGMAGEAPEPEPEEVGD